jgi:histidinol-phosphate/aromatic aminotransferase/cobyric acid decarboxylase-like protein
MVSYGYPRCIRINVGRPEENERFIRALRQVRRDVTDGSSR